MLRGDLFDAAAYATRGSRFGAIVVGATILVAYPCIREVKVTWEQDSRGLTINWDSTVEPYLSVFRLDPDGNRKVIAEFVSRGEVFVPASSIEGGGIEIQLGDWKRVQILAP